MIFSRDPELKRRIEIAKTKKRSGSNLLHDPIEDDEELAVIIRKAQWRADAEIPAEIKMGRCHGIWKRMKEILKEEHGLIWYSPREMNPGVKFD